MPEPGIAVNWGGEYMPNPYIKFQKFDAFMLNMDNISILITVKKLALKTYSLAEVYPQSIISGLKDISQYGIIS